MSNIPSLRESLRVAKKLGCIITHYRRTNELRIYHDCLAMPLRIKATQKDSSRQLLTALRQIASINN